MGQEESKGQGRRLLTVQELADLLQVPQSWIYARTAANEIPHVRVGRYVRFKAGEVMRWLEDQAAA